MISLTEFQLTLPEGADLGPWAANRLRGAVGMSLRHISCTTGARTCAGCPLRTACAYGYCFETQTADEGRFHASGQDAPRPYVLRAGEVSEDGRRFRFQLVLIGRAARMFPYFALAVKDWEQPGRGPGRQGARLDIARAMHPFDGRDQVIYEAPGPELVLPDWQGTLEGLARAADALPGDRLAVEFLTPTRLRFRGEPVRSHPPFHALVSALLRRLETLRDCHDLPAVVDDARGLIALSDAVELVAWEGRREQRGRHSRRRGQTMQWEGFVGQAVYRGDLRPFLPALKLGELVHVGKGTVFGLGRMALAGAPRMGG